MGDQRAMGDYLTGWDLGEDRLIRRSEERFLKYYS